MPFLSVRADGRGCCHGLHALHPQHQPQRYPHKNWPGEHNGVVVAPGELDEPAVAVWPDDGGELGRFALKAN